MSIPIRIPEPSVLPHYEPRSSATNLELELAGRRLQVPVRQLGAQALVEVWPEADVLYGAVSVEDAGDVETAARDVYAGLIAEVRAAGFPYFVRMWNYVGSINEGREEGRERYQLFCAGRHDAFVSAGYHHDVDLPAASAVGMPGRGLVTYFLAAREAGVQVENPRQIAAYHYPPQYGVKSPSFSRATIWKDTVFVSGTSSVVGHESVHQGDVVAQLDETLRNIEIVLGQVGRDLSNAVIAKTYIRDPRDYEAIASRLEPVFPSNIYLHSDICRADLLLEIECIAR